LLAVRSQDIVVDIGAGSLQYSLRIAGGLPCRVIALDLGFDPSGAEAAKRRRVQRLQASGEQLPFLSRSVDRVLLSSVLQMVPHPDRLLSECVRVLKPGGILVMSVPNEYQYVEAFLESSRYRFIRRIVGLDWSKKRLVAVLNDRFRVGGPNGYYSFERLSNLLSENGLSILEHRYAPGPFGSFVWEMGVLAFARLGGAALHILLPILPIALLIDRIQRAPRGSEHVVKLTPRSFS
jgi:SAM-dependent methyltransferase